MSNHRTDKRAAIKRRFARAVAIFRRRRWRGSLQTLLNRAVNKIRHLQIRKPGKTGIPAVNVRQLNHGPTSPASASAISAAYFGTTMALALMHERPPLSKCSPPSRPNTRAQFSIQSRRQ